MVDAEGVSLVPDMPVVVRNNVVLVERALADDGNKTFPDSRAAARFEQMGVIVPSIEIADDRNLSRIRCPYSKIRSRLAINGGEPCAELVIRAVVAPFVEQIKII